MAALVASVTGIPNLVANLSRMSKGTRKQLRGAIVEIATEKLAITQERVPVKRGKLKATGRASVRVGKKQLTAKIIYGSEDVKYAAKIHEDLSLRHPHGGQGKYVESVILQTRFADEVASRFELGAALSGQGSEADAEIKP